MDLTISTQHLTRLTKCSICTDAVKMMVCPLAFSKSAQMIHVINATSDHDSLILVLKKERQIAAFSVFGVCVCV